MFCYTVDEDIKIEILQLRHAEQLLALTIRNREHLEKWMQWVHYMHALEDTKAFIKESQQQFADNNGFYCGIWFKGELAGSIGFHAFDWENKNTYLGYWLGEEFQGHGIITRAVEAATSYAIFDLGMERVMIKCAIGNEKSTAVPERLGYVYEGTLRHAQRLNGKYYNQRVYSILAQEWKEREEAKMKVLAIEE